jgi:hypothetical protein
MGDSRKCMAHPAVFRLMVSCRTRSGSHRAQQCFGFRRNDGTRVLRYRKIIRVKAAKSHMPAAWQLISTALRVARAPCLLEGRRIHQAAVGPLGVQSAFELEGRVDSDIAFIHFAVVADHLDDVVGPFFVQTQRLAVTRADT